MTERQIKTLYSADGEDFDTEDVGELLYFMGATDGGLGIGDPYMEAQFKQVLPEDLALGDGVKNIIDDAIYHIVDDVAWDRCMDKIGNDEIAELDAIICDWMTRHNILKDIFGYVAGTTITHYVTGADVENFK